MLLGITRGLVNAVMIILLTEAHFQEMQCEIFLRFSSHSPTVFISLLVCFVFTLSVRNSFFSIYETVSCMMSKSEKDLQRMQVTSSFPSFGNGSCLNSVQLRPLHK